MVHGRSADNDTDYGRRRTMHGHEVRRRDVTYTDRRL